MLASYVDTNYFLRFLIRDSESHYLKARSLFEAAIRKDVSLFTSTLVFFETYWVLTNHYQLDKSHCSTALKSILRMSFIELEERENLHYSLLSSLGLEDCYHICKAASLGYSIASFDKKLNRIFEKITN